MTTKAEFDPTQKLQRQVKLDRKTLSEDGTFEGYGSVFGVEDSYGDIVAPGAFKDSLAEHAEQGTLPALLWQHRSDQPIGVYEEMREDDRGLYVKGRLELETQGGKEAYALMKSGAINGLSIGFMAKKWEWDDDDGILTLLEIDLWEVSIVTFPANGQARVSGTKSIEEIDGLATWKSFEANLRDAGGYSRSAAAAMVAAARRISDDERDAQDDFAAFKASSDRLINTLKT